MSQKKVPILHVDGSLTEYIDKKGVLHKVAGLGGYLVVGGKIVEKFYKELNNLPHLNYHENYAIIEGLKWVYSMGYRNIKVKSDSQGSVSLFTHHKRNVNKIDKFFLLQYLTVEFNFNSIELYYHNRSDNDLSHHLSRTYLKELPKDVVRLHAQKNKKKIDYRIVADAAQKCEYEINRILKHNMKELISLF